jgi:flagellar protein FlgJ
MQLDAIRPDLSVSSEATIAKVKNKQQANDFAARLKEITDAPNSAAEDAKLRKVCQDMEAVFLNLMLTQMRATIPKTGLTGGQSNADGIYQSLLDTEMTKEMAAAGGVGIADAMYRQLARDESKITSSPTLRPIVR